MSIYPQISTNLGSIPGIVANLASLQRQLDTSLAQRTIIQPGTIQGTGSGGVGHIKAASISAPEIAAGSITAELIQAESITAIAIAAGTITATQIAAGTITAGQIAAGTITAAQIAAGTITAAQIAAGAITAAKISVVDLSAINVNAGTITTIQLTLTADPASYVGTAAPGTTPRVWLDRDGLHGIDGSGNTVLDANAVSGSITAKAFFLAGSSGLANITGQITNSQIATNAVTSTKIGNDQIQTPHMAANSISGNVITTNTLSASTINGGTLGSVVVDLGSGKLLAGTAGGASAEYDASGIKAYDYVGGIRTNTLHISSADGSITATKGTITGATLRTAATGARVQMDGITNALRVFDASEAVPVRLDADNGLTLLPSMSGGNKAIRWIIPGENPRASIVAGAHGAGGSDIRVSALTTANGGGSQAHLVANYQDATWGINERAGVHAYGDLGRVDVNAATTSGSATTRTLVNSDAKSDFARLPVLGNAMVCAARFEGRPSVGVQVYGSVPASIISSIVRAAQGVYDITLSVSAPSGTWIATGSSFGTAATACITQWNGATTIRAILYSVTGVLVDDAFTLTFAG